MEDAASRLNSRWSAYFPAATITATWLLHRYFLIFRGQRDKF